MNISVPNRSKENIVLPMIAYTSGFLHIGHLRSYVACDIIGRWLSIIGYNVRIPFGFDSHGLPTEMKAREQGLNPVVWTDICIKQMLSTLRRLDLMFDLDNIIVTSYPNYYFREQKIFVDLYKAGLIYRKKSNVFWDPIAQTTLAREQINNGYSDRTNAKVEVKELDQWFFRLSQFAESLYGNLNSLTGWVDEVLNRQKSWIDYGLFKVIKVNTYDIYINSKLKTYNHIITNGDIKDLELTILNRQIKVVNIPGIKFNYLFHSKDIMQSFSVEELTNNYPDLLNEIYESKLHDWCISRQRYFGCPIPAAYCEKCGWICSESLIRKSAVTNEFYPDSIKDLENWSIVQCPECLGKAKQDTDTLDVLFDSSFYPIEYCSNNIDSLPIYLYIGGAEHSTGHLIYIRAMFMALNKIGYNVPFEPVTNFYNNGLILCMSYKDEKGGYLYADKVVMEGESIFSYNDDNQKVKAYPFQLEKMSKSKKNIIRLEELLNSGWETSELRFSIFSDYPLNMDFAWDITRLNNARTLFRKLKKIYSNNKSSYPSFEWIEVNKEWMLKIGKLFQSLKFNLIIAEIYKGLNRVSDPFFLYCLQCITSVFAPSLTIDLALKWPV